MWVTINIVHQVLHCSSHMLVSIQSCTSVIQVRYTWKNIRTLFNDNSPGKPQLDGYPFMELNRTLKYVLSSNHWVSSSILITVTNNSCIVSVLLQPYLRYFDTTRNGNHSSFLIPTELGGRCSLQPKICA